MVYSGHQKIQLQHLQKQIQYRLKQSESKIRSRLGQFIIFLIILSVIFIIYYVTTHKQIFQTNKTNKTKEHYTNSGSSDKCAGCNNYSNFLHLNDDCYLKHLYNINMTNLLANIYNSDKFCNLGYISTP